MGFSDSSVGKESTCNVGDPSLIPGSGRSPAEGIGYPRQYPWASLVAQLVKNVPVMQETWVRSLGGKIPWRRERLPTPVFWPRVFYVLDSPCGLKELDMTECPCSCPCSLSLFMSNCTPVKWTTQKKWTDS